VVLILGLGAEGRAQQEIGHLFPTPEDGAPSNPFLRAGFQDPEPIEAPNPSPSDEELDPYSPFKPIGRIGLAIESPLGGARPEGKSLVDQEEGIPVTTVLARPWPTISYTWVAAATRHNPLYFEEINAERYGYTCSPCLQPVISTAHFFGTIPALPYLKGADCPWECQYTLGHYRPGSCNPWRRHYWPVSARGALCQAGVVTGVVFLP
jgi:hypothetical protein